MNSLSWFLYLAGIVNSLSKTIGVFAFVFTIGYGLFCVYQAAENNKYKYWCFAWIAPLFMLISCLIPSKETMYMIAASEMGERVYQSKDVQEIKSVLVEAIKKLGK